MSTCCLRAAGLRLRRPLHWQAARPATRRTPGGFTVVELMVAMLIGSLIALAAGSLAVSFDSGRKTNIASSTSNGNGAAALSALDSQIAMSGAGLISNQAQACLQLYSNQGGYNNNGLNFNPLLIDTDSNANSDMITFAYASGGSVDSMLKLSAALPTLTSNVTISAVNSVNIGDDIFFSFDNANSYACTLRRVTTIGTSAGTSTLGFGSSDPNTGLAVNGALTSPPSYDTSSYLMPLGTLKFQQWYAENGMLKFKDLLSGNINVVADGIVYLRAQYGLDSGGGLSWADLPVTQPSLNPQQFSALRSVRIAMIARSPDREKQSNAANCITTTNPNIPLGGEWGVSVDVSALQNTSGTALIPDWQCYSYRAFDSVTPLRNFFWATAS